MKKIISLLLILALTLSCVSCAKKDLNKQTTENSAKSTSVTDTSAASDTTKNDTGSSAAATTKTDTASSSASSSSASSTGASSSAKSSSDSHTGIDAEDDDDFEQYFSSAAPNENIDVTFPLAWINVETEEDLDQYVKDNGYQKGVIASDEIAMITMTGAQHNELLSNLNTEIRDMLNGLVGADDTPHVTSAEAIWNFTEFDLIFDGELNLTEHLLPIGLMYWGGLWNVLAGTSVPDEGIRIIYYDADSGDITYDSYATQSSSESDWDDDWDSDWSFGTTTDFSEPTIDPFDIINTDKVLISLHEIIPNDTWGYTLNLNISNRTEDALTVEIENTSVNGVMIGSGRYIDLDPRDSVSTDLTIDANDILAAGIEDPTQISFVITAKPGDDWSNERLYVRDVYTIYPLGVDQANNKVSFDYAANTNRDKLYDSQECILHSDNNRDKDYGFVIYDVDPNGDWGYTFKTYVFNNTDKVLAFAWDDFVCDGWLFNSMDVAVLTPGTWKLEDLYISAGEMEALHYDYIYDVCIHTKITDYYDYEAEPLYDYDYGFTTKPDKKYGTDVGEGDFSIKFIPKPGTDTVLEYSNERYSITIKSEPLTENDFWGTTQYVLPLFASQLTTQRTYVSMEDVTLNGVEFESFWGCEFRGNGQYSVYRPLDWTSEQLADMGIDKVKTISFTLVAYNLKEDDEEKALLMREKFTYTLE